MKGQGQKKVFFLMQFFQQSVNYDQVFPFPETLLEYQDENWFR
jgi:hypothetical protein